MWTGFGGYSYKDFRLWIDEELETGTYANPDDNTYEKGYLLDPSITKFNVKRDKLNVLIIVL